MFKKLSAIIIAITIILVNSNYVNAGILDIGTVATGLNGVFNLADSNEKKRSDLSNWLNQNSDWAGFIFDGVSFGTYLTPSVVWSCLPQSIKDQISDSTDETEVLNKTIDMILEGQSVSGNNITNNTNVNTFIKNIQNDYVSNNRAFLYSFTLDEYASARNISTNLYLKLKEKIPQVSDISNTVYFLKNTGNNVQVFSLDLYTYPYVYARYGTSVSGIYGSFQLVNGYDNTNITLSGLGWNSTDQSFSNEVTDNGKVQGLLENIDIFTSPTGVWGNGSVCFVSNHIRKSIRLFNGIATATDLLYQPYYYNNEVWQDFSKSSGDYVFSPSNINTVSYGDTISYIDNYIQDKGYPPTIPDININIENENNNNVNGGSGGGGSGGDDSGGGSGSGTDGIFDFLSDLGAVLGNLIKNLGQAITNIIKGISDLVTSIVTDLPTVFFDFIGAIFGWLPEEWVTLLSLSLAAMLIWGIVKVIRG